jgi:squalene synthase HpnC
MSQIVSLAKRSSSEALGQVVGIGEADQVQSLIDISLRAAAQSSGENFAVAARVIPRQQRDLLNRLYRFARFVDDVGDEAPGNRLQLLDIVEADVRRLESADTVPTLPVVADLRPLVDECGAPIGPMLDLVAANRMDQQVSRYQTFDALLDYCALSAAPVGRLVLYIAGAAAQENIRLSDSACAALQVLEHCQDVGEDARAGRVYLPQDDLARAGVVTGDLLAAHTSEGVRAAVAHQVDRAQQLLHDARPLVRRLHGWARLAVGGYLAGGSATAAALRRQHFDVLARTIRPSRVETAARALALITVAR